MCIKYSKTREYNFDDLSFVFQTIVLLIYSILCIFIHSSQENPKKGGYLLDLSTHSLTVKTCAVLAKCLATDRAFAEVRLNDCMLPEEG